MDADKDAELLQKFLTQGQQKHADPNIASQITAVQAQIHTCLQMLKKLCEMPKSDRTQYEKVIEHESTERPIEDLMGSFFDSYTKKWKSFIKPGVLMRSAFLHAGTMEFQPVYIKYNQYPIGTGSTIGVIRWLGDKSISVGHEFDDEKAALKAAHEYLEDLERCNIDQNAGYYLASKAGARMDVGLIIIPVGTENILNDVSEYLTSGPEF